MYELTPNVVMVPVTQLRELPQNAEVHADFDPHGKDMLLVQNVAKNGVLLPLLIDGDKYVRDGTRRKRAAQLVKQVEVPCVVLQAGEDASVYRSAQLARQQTVYARIVMNRDELEALVARGNNERSAHLKRGTVLDEQDDDAAALLDDQWTQWGLCLNLSRSVIRKGIRVLRDLDRLYQTGEKDDFDTAEKVKRVFRNEGLKPAMRLLGYKVDGKQADLEDDGQQEVDTNAWATEPPKPKRVRRNGVHAPTPKLNIDTDKVFGLNKLEAAEVVEDTVQPQPPNVRIANMDDDDDCDWRDEALYHLCELRGIIRERVPGGFAEDWFDQIRDVITSEAAYVEAA